MRIKGMVLYTVFASFALGALLYVLFPELWPSHIASAIAAHGGPAKEIFWLACAIAALIAIASIAFGRSRDTASLPQQPYSRLLSDRPIQSEEDDEFRRREMADVLARELTLPPGSSSIVVGLEGPWGCGKSSLLALVELRLAKLSPKPVIVHFNPWILSTVGDLVDAFFTQLSDECATQGAAPSLVSALDQFRREIERDRIDGVTRLGLQAWQIVSRLLLKPTARPDFLSRKQAISDLLARMIAPVVVIVDDVDRLPPEQIRSVFQLIKAVGDFNRVSYLIAYDPIPVYDALETGRVPGYGKDYKEKIIQVAVPFPRQPYIERKAYIRKIVVAALEQWGLRLSRAEEELVDSALPILARALATPRQAKVAVNQAFLLSGLVGSEIAIADLVSFGTLSTRFPDLVAAIRRQPTLVTRRDSLDEEYIAGDFSGFLKRTTEEKKQDELEAVTEQLYKDPVDREQALALIRFVLPETTEEGEAGLRRLRDENNFLTFLYLGVRGGLISNADVENLIYSASERAALMDEHEAAGSLAGFLTFAGQRTQEGRSIPELAAFMVLLLERSRKVPEEQSETIVDTVAKFAQSLFLKAANTPEEKQAALRAVVLDGKFLSPGEEVFTRILSYLGLWEQGLWKGLPGPRRGNQLDWLSIDDADGIRREWLRLVDDCPIELLMRREPRVIGILHRRGQLAPNDYGSVQGKLTSWLQEAADNVRVFASRFPRGNSFSGTDQLVLSGFDLLKAFKEASVPERQIERLLEDCPVFGQREPEGPGDEQGAGA